MKIYKYDANGNSFLITQSNERRDRSELARKLCKRIQMGADGLIIILPSPAPHLAFEWDFYNRDGSRAKMCGNGARAAGHFAYFYCDFVGEKYGKEFTFLSGAGEVGVRIFKDKNADENEAEVEVNLGRAKIEKTYLIEGDLVLGLVHTGVPHLVHFCEAEALAKFDKKLCERLRKKYEANVNFASIKNKNLMLVRTFERGVEDETGACGTGMMACFALALHNKLINENIKIRPSSGEEVGARISADGELFLRGMVRKVGEEELDL